MTPKIKGAELPESGASNMNGSIIMTMNPNGISNAQDKLAAIAEIRAIRLILWSSD
jgi:hypothetical protein